MELFQKPKNVVTRWFSFENPRGEKGNGALKNKSAKGHPAEFLNPGQSVKLMDAKGPGVVRRIWMTVDVNQNPQMLRSLRIDMFWDGARKPAVSAPLGDFFGVGLGRKTAFQSAFFSDPEGRSFNCLIPMPFRKRAIITLSNESKKTKAMLFYDVNVTLGDQLTPDALYFHTHWNRENYTKLGTDFEILPKVKGAGRFLGCNISLIENPRYHYQWFGEGEVKMFIDNDSEHPTLVGTGTEDYIGTAWGQGVFANRTQGCLVADRDGKMWSFYRYHVDDPVYFDLDCRITIQQMGGSAKHKLLEAIKRGANLILVSVATPTMTMNMFEQRKPWKIEDKRIPNDAWCNYYREDDVAACAYFYLDNPENNLPALAPVGIRTAGI